MSGFDAGVVVVTGAGSGMGRELALQLARSARVVVAVDINAELLSETTRLIKDEGHRAASRLVDVSSREDIDCLIDSVVAEYGRIDCIFNNAGVGYRGDVLDATRLQWDNIHDVNCQGVINGSLAAYQAMRGQAQGGMIVNTSSLAGLVPVPGIIPYTVARHAVVGFSLALAAEARLHGVTVCVVCPGPVRTGFHDAVITPVGHKQPRCPENAVSCEEAVRIILRGVKRRSRLIVFPLRARLTWLLFRFSPRLFGKLADRIAQRQSRVIKADRTEPEDDPSPMAS